MSPTTITIFEMNECDIPSTSISGRTSVTDHILSFEGRARRAKEGRAQRARISLWKHPYFILLLYATILHVTSYTRAFTMSTRSRNSFSDLSPFEARGLIFGAIWNYKKPRLQLRRHEPFRYRPFGLTLKSCCGIIDWAIRMTSTLWMPTNTSREYLVFRAVHPPSTNVRHACKARWLSRPSVPILQGPPRNLTKVFRLTSRSLEHEALTLWWALVLVFFCWFAFSTMIMQIEIEFWLDLLTILCCPWFFNSTS